MCGAGCTNLATDIANCGLCGTHCDSDYDCLQGACSFVNPCNKSSEHLCNGSCVDFSTDSNNCGACGATCPRCQATRAAGDALPPGAHEVLRSPGHEVLILQACHPRFFATHRYLVYARPVSVTPRSGPSYTFGTDRVTLGRR